MQKELSFTGLDNKQKVSYKLERVDAPPTHLVAHLRQQIILIHENTLAPIVRRDRLDIRQARLNIIAEPLPAPIRRRLLDDLDHAPALQLDLLPRLPAEHLERAAHPERIVVPHRDPRRQQLPDRRAPLADERAPRQRVVL